MTSTALLLLCLAGHGYGKAAQADDAADTASTSSPERQRLADANEQFGRDNYADAALTAYDLVSEAGSDAALSLDARLLLGKSLYRLGLNHAALWAFAGLLEAQPSGKHAQKALEWLVFISRKTQNKQLVLDEMAKHPPAVLPDRYRSELAALLSQQAYFQGVSFDRLEQKPAADPYFADAARYAAQIPQGDAFYPTRRYLEGLVAFRNNRASEAIEGFKDALRNSRAKADDAAAEVERRRFRDLAFMQLARTHYGKKQDRHALHYYSKVERGGAQWLDSLFEGSWAAFRIGEDERALGNLVTLSSPFFKDEYYPEATLIKAIIHYENCRFGEARSQVDELMKTYEPLQVRLDELAAVDRSVDIFDTLKKSDTPEARRTLSLLKADRGINEVLGSLGELEAELQRFDETTPSFSASGLAHTAREALERKRSDLQVRVHALAQQKLKRQSEELKQLFGDGLRIKVEISTQEKDLLEAKLAGRNAKEAALTDYDYPVEASDDELYWPLQNEYWRDELGSYLYTLTRGCNEERANAASLPRASR